MVYITYNMGNRDLPDIYAHALGPAALGLGHIYQANPSYPEEGGSDISATKKYFIMPLNLWL